MLVPARVRAWEGGSCERVSVALGPMDRRNLEFRGAFHLSPEGLWLTRPDALVASPNLPQAPRVRIPFSAEL